MASTTNIFHHAHYPTISPSNPANDQKGRTVLITGGSGGIGYAIAQAFITANASQVILTGRNQDSLNRAATRLAKSATTTIVKPFICDLDDEASIETLWQSLDDASITLDVLVLNAAESASSPIRPVRDFRTKLRAFFNTNLFANTLMVSRLLDSLVDKNDTTPKAIINISSFMAHSNPAPFQAAYSTSKAAFAHTLQLLADEVAAEECQIINVHPGAILTEAARNAPQEVKDAVVWDDANLPAAFAVWASTKQASFLHGRFVWSNWDVEELATRKAELADPGFLKLGLQGTEYVNITTIFDKIRK